MTRLVSNGEFGSGQRSSLVVSEIGASEPVFETDFLILGALPKTRSSRNGRYHVVVPDRSIAGTADPRAYYFDADAGTRHRFEPPEGAVPLVVSNEGIAYFQAAAGLFSFRRDGTSQFSKASNLPEYLTTWVYAPAWVLSADENRLAVAMTDPSSSEDIVRVYDIGTGKIDQDFPVPQQDSQYVGSLGFVDDGVRVALVDYSNKTSRRILVFDLKKGPDPVQLFDYSSSTESAYPELSIDGQQLAIVRSDGVIELHSQKENAAGEAEVQQAALPKLVAGLGGLENLTDVALSPDNSLIATADYDGQLWLWDLATGRAIREFGSYHLARMVFSGDGDRLVVLGSDNIQMFDIRTRRILKRYQPSGSIPLLFQSLGDGVGYLICHIRGCEFQPSSDEVSGIDLNVPLYLKKAAACGQRIFLVSEEETGLTLQFVNFDHSTPEQSGVVHSRPLEGIEVSVLGCDPQGNAYVGTKDGRILKFTAEGEPSGQRALGDGAIQAIQALPDQLVLIGVEGENTAPADKPAEIFGLETRNLETLFKVAVPLSETGNGSHLYQMKVSRDFSRLVTATEYGGHETPNNTLVWDLKALLAAKGAVGSPVELDAESYLLHTRIAIGGRKPKGIAFSPDGKKLVVTFNSQSAIWDLETGQMSGIQDHEFGDGLKFNDSGYFYAESGKGLNYVGNDRSTRNLPLPKPAEDSVFSFIMTGSSIYSGGETFAIAADEGTVIWPQGRLEDGDTSSYLLPAPGTYTLHRRSLDSGGKRLLIHATNELVMQDVRNRTDPQIWKISDELAGMEVRSIESAALTTDGRHVLVKFGGVFTDYDLVALDAETGETTHKWKPGPVFGPQVVPVRISHPGNGPELFALLKSDGRGFAEFLMSPDMADPPQIDLLGLRPARATASPDGKLLVVMDSDERVLLWDRETGRSRMLDAQVFQAVMPAHAIAISPDNTLLAAMETSGLVSIFHIETTEKLGGLLNLANGGWAVVGPEGRYDASDPGNVGRLSWIVEDEPLFPVPVEAFIQEYYEPRLLARLIAGEELAPLAPPQDKIRVTPEIDGIDVIPPSQRGELSPSVTIRLAVAERERNGVRSGLGAIKLFRDGQLVALAESPRLGADGTVELQFDDIALPSDQTAVQFSAYAFNSDGIKGRSVEKGFQVPEGLSVDVGRRAFVIAVGVNAYDNPAWNLSYAASDAEATAEIMRRAIEASGAFDKVYSVGLLSRISEAESEVRLARRDVIETVIGQLSGRPLDASLPERLRDQLPILPKARPQDLVYIAFAGHGLAGSDGRFHFFTQEFGAGTKGRQMSDDMLSSSLDSDRLTGLLRGIDARDMVLVIDACNSAASVEGSGFKPGPMGSKGLGQIAYDKSMRVMAASQAEAVALESDTLRHGALTYALMREGLEAGQADRAPNDGSVSIGELLGYSRDRVPDLYRSLRTGVFEPLSRGAFSLLEDEDKPEIPAQQPALFDFRQTSRADVVLGIPN
ncbi:hypothetical protein [Roseibium sp. SCP14]|uniref:hypothetical protein n=1 Tax=Roseibium sp. SCP14 TaxID=3141375 RepID=UPI00333A96EE